MVFYLLIILLASAEPLTSTKTSNTLEYLSKAILEYPTLSILISLISLTFALLIVRHIYKSWTSSGDLKILVRSKHLMSKENKYLIP